jgi:hypothetical protein
MTSGRAKITASYGVTSCAARHNLLTSRTELSWHSRFRTTEKSLASKRSQPWPRFWHCCSASLHVCKCLQEQQRAGVYGPSCAASEWHRCSCCRCSQIRWKTLSCQLTMPDICGGMRLKDALMAV